MKRNKTKKIYITLQDYKPQNAYLSLFNACQELTLKYTTAKNHIKKSGNTTDGSKQIYELQLNGHQKRGKNIQEIKCRFIE